MSTTLTHVKPAVAASLATWHKMVAARDMAPLRSIVHPQAMVRSPLAFSPFKSADAVVMVLSTVNDVFENFRYGRELYSADGLNVLLEFSASVGDKELKGIDLIRFDEEGKILDFEVMIRPLNALQALGQEMGKRLGQHLPAYKESKAAE